MTASASNVDACVEVRAVSDGTNTVIVVRDSKDSAGPVLEFTSHEWQAFLDGVRNDEFDLPAEARPLYPELADDLKCVGEQVARHKAGLS